MTKIKFHWIELINRSKTVDVPFPPSLFEEDDKFDNYQDLINNIRYYYEDLYYHEFLDDDELSTLSEFEYIELINESDLEEIAKNYLHLIEKPQTIKCCDDQTGNYCSVCGTKLK